MNSLQQHQRCECHDCTQARYRMSALGLNYTFNYYDQFAARQLGDACNTAAAAASQLADIPIRVDIKRT